MNWVTTVISVIMATLLAGCGLPIHKRFTIDGTPPTSVAVDAQQRMVFVTDKGGHYSTKAGDDGKPRRVVCAEPSPDAITTTSAALGAKFSTGDKAVGLDSAFAQAFAEIGARTPVIQLLRDGLFRACEAYMNGVLSGPDYERIVRHYDTTMVALVAVDGLTRCSVAPGGTKGLADSSGSATGYRGKKPPQLDSQTPSPVADISDSGAGMGVRAANAPTESPSPAPGSNETETGGGNNSKQKTDTHHSVSGHTEASAEALERTAVGNCQVTPELAQKVNELVTIYLAYKKPLHEAYCVSTSLKELMQGAEKAGERAEKAGKQPDPVDLKVMMDMAKQICESAPSAPR